MLVQKIENSKSLASYWFDSQEQQLHKTIFSDIIMNRDNLGRAKCICFELAVVNFTHILFFFLIFHIVKSTVNSFVTSPLSSCIIMFIHVYYITVPLVGLLWKSLEFRHFANGGYTNNKYQFNQNAPNY